MKDVDENEWPLLHVAVHQQRVDIAKVLIENGADVNVAQRGRTPTLHCVRKQNG